MSKSEHSTDTRIFDTTEENNPDLIQLIDISDNTVSPHQKNADNENIQKQYTSNGHNIPYNKVSSSKMNYNLDDFSYPTSV